MPVGRMGPRCEEYGKRPADHLGLCQLCHAFLAAFGHHPDEPSEPVFTAEEPEFEAELRHWLDAA